MADTVAVIGLGKIGLPLAVQFALSGRNVVGVDVSETTVDLVNSGIEPFPGEVDLKESLQRALETETLRATTSYKDGLRDAKVVLIAVPVGLSEDLSPDLSTLAQACTSIGELLSPEMLVLVESTVPVGTTRNVVTKLLETKSGLKEGTEFFVAFSPERVLSGRVFSDLRRYPKLIGGVSKIASEAAQDFYSAVITFDPRPELPKPNGVWNLGSSEAAEFAKLAETTYRDVNIALANEFRQVANNFGLDYRAVVEACNSQPFSHLHEGGISVGGHCIPVYPWLLLDSNPELKLPKLARSINSSIPDRYLQRLEIAVGKLLGLTVLILGVSYRGNVKEVSNSGAFRLSSEIKRLGGVPFVFDPLYSSAEIEGYGLNPGYLQDKYDCVILHSDHDLFKSMSGKTFQSAKAVMDGRGILDPDQWPNLILGL